MNPLQQMQQEKIRAAMLEELRQATDKTYMPWTEDLDWWHVVAFKCLEYLSIKDLEVSYERYPLLLERSATKGLTLTCIEYLANNLERCNPNQLCLSLDQYRDIIALNREIGAKWTKMVAPIQKSIQKRYEIMSNTPGGLKIAEA